jgi:hypothetical protein
VIATTGNSTLAWDGGELDLPVGTTAVIPAGAGSITFNTDGTVLVARPPVPNS